MEGPSDVREGVRGVPDSTTAGDAVLRRVVQVCHALVALACVLALWWGVGRFPDWVTIGLLAGFAVNLFMAARPWDAAR